MNMSFPPSRLSTSISSSVSAPLLNEVTLSLSIFTVRLMETSSADGERERERGREREREGGREREREGERERGRERGREKERE